MDIYQYFQVPTPFTHFLTLFILFVALLLLTGSFNRQRHLFTWDDLPEVREMFADVKARVAADLFRKGLMEQTHNHHHSQTHYHESHHLEHPPLPPPPMNGNSSGAESTCSSSCSSAAEAASSSSSSPSSSASSATLPASITNHHHHNETNSTHHHSHHHDTGSNGGGSSNSSSSSSSSSSRSNKYIALLEHCVSDCPSESEVWELLTYDGPHREKWISLVDRWMEPSRTPHSPAGGGRARGGRGYHRSGGRGRGRRSSTWR
jgi:hypothetical protein